jgi:hypothetical protein
MKEDTRWKIIVGTGLVTLSLALYTIHYLIFQDARHVLIYLFGDIAFIPIEVLIVTLIIDQMLEARERQQRMEKLNMVIGTFFSTTGTPLLTLLVRADPGIATLRQRLIVRDSWKKNDFLDMKGIMANYECGVDVETVDMESARKFLVEREDFLLRLVENPMVFEHETFTDLILAINHLTEELKARDTLTGLPKDDTGHLAIDLRRVYSRLIPEWLRYMEYLQINYPYLFHLAMRKNPFDATASVIIGRAP